MFFLKKNFIFVLTVLFTITASQAYFKKNDTGEEAFAFLGSFYSARSAAMENANAAKPSSNPGSVLQNPAAIVLDSNQKNAVSFSWQTSELAENQGYIAYARRVGAMVAELSYGWIRYGDVDGYDWVTRPAKPTVRRVLSPLYPFPFRSPISNSVPQSSLQPTFWQTMEQTKQPWLSLLTGAFFGSPRPANTVLVLLPATSVR